MQKLEKTVLDACENHGGDWVSITEAIKNFGEVEGDPYDFWRRFKKKYPVSDQLTQLKNRSICLRAKDIISVLAETESEFGAKAKKALKKLREEESEAPKKSRGTKRKASGEEDGSDDDWEPSASSSSRSPSPDKPEKKEAAVPARERHPPRSGKPKKQVRFEVPPEPKKKPRGRPKKKPRLHERRPPKPEEPMRYFYCDANG